MKLFRLDEWFSYDYYDKEYAQFAVKTLDKLIGQDKNVKGCLIEIGCGLGDVIGNIKKQKGMVKIGFDKEMRVVRVAKILHPDMSFKKGSFADVRHKQIYCLIMINFLHFIDPDYAKREVKKVLNNNYVKYVVLDELRNTKKSSYQYECDGNDILGERYVPCCRSRRMNAAKGANRRVVVYKRA